VTYVHSCGIRQRPGRSKPQAHIVAGNVKDPGSLDVACRGVDVVVTTATMSKRGDDSPENVDWRGSAGRRR